MSGTRPSEIVCAETEIMRPSIEGVVVVSLTIVSNVD